MQRRHRADREGGPVSALEPPGKEDCPEQQGTGYAKDELIAAVHPAPLRADHDDGAGQWRKATAQQAVDRAHRAEIAVSVVFCGRIVGREVIAGPVPAFAEPAEQPQGDDPVDAAVAESENGHVHDAQQGEPDSNRGPRPGSPKEQAVDEEGNWDGDGTDPGEESDSRQVVAGLPEKDG